MLKKTERLTRDAFTACFSSGRRHHSPTFTVVTCPSPSFHGAVVVGKKVSKKAVKRNQVRRSLYGALYELHKKQEISGTVIVIVKPSARDCSTKGLRSELRTFVLKKLASLSKAR